MHWYPPSPGFEKLNFDGFLHGNPGISGIAVCIRDNRGDILAVKSSPLQQGTNNMEKVHVLFVGLVLARKGGFQHTQVEGDSMVIINACIKRESHNWRLASILQQIWILLDTFQEICISRTLHKGNMVADYMTNRGCEGLDVETDKSMGLLQHDNDLKKLITIDKQFIQHM